MVMDRAYHREYSRKYYHKRRRPVFAILGGECSTCGSLEDLQVDHKDHTEKNFPLGKLLNFKWEQVIRELELCQLLCRVCHLDKSKIEGSFRREHTNNWISGSVA